MEQTGYFIVTCEIADSSQGNLKQSSNISSTDEALVEPLVALVPITVLVAFFGTSVVVSLLIAVIFFV